jgi:hypothetical protein
MMIDWYDEKSSNNKKDMANEWHFSRNLSIIYQFLSVNLIGHCLLILHSFVRKKSFSFTVGEIDDRCLIWNLQVPWYKVIQSDLQIIKVLNELRCPKYVTKSLLM